MMIVLPLGIPFLIGSVFSQNSSHTAKLIGYLQYFISPNIQQLNPIWKHNKHYEKIIYPSYGAALDLCAQTSVHHLQLPEHH